MVMQVVLHASDVHAVVPLVLFIVQSLQLPTLTQAGSELVGEDIYIYMLSSISLYKTPNCTSRNTLDLAHGQTAIAGAPMAYLVG